jgi:threonyl-tRNA synthetase
MLQGKSPRVFPSESLSQRSVQRGFFIDSLTSAQVNGELWDLERPLEASCRLQLLDFDDPEGMVVDDNMSGN